MFVIPILHFRGCYVFSGMKKMDTAQWRAEREANGAPAPGIQGRGQPKSKITKVDML